jgi:cardiolipin synthase
VDVRIVVPGPYIDLKAVRYASRGIYKELLEAGVKIFEFQPTMLHSKVMVVDNVWSSIGSINFSSRSMKANAEANVAIYDQAFAGQVKGLIEADITRSEEIVLEQWKHRSLWQRIRERYFSLYKDVF